MTGHSRQQMRPFASVHMSKLLDNAPVKQQAGARASRASVLRLNSELWLLAA